MGDRVDPELSLGLNVLQSPELEAVELLFAGHFGKLGLRNPAIPCSLILRQLCRVVWGREANGSTELGTGAGKEILR